eukprot:Skav213048  [mRNA]  locus=scaffold3001:48187:49737:+ [translate_table: standard]
MVASTLSTCLEPNLSEHHGKNANVVAIVQFRCPGASVCTVRTTGEVFMTDVSIPPQAFQIAIMQAAVNIVNGRTWLTHQQDTAVFQPNQPGIEAFQHVVEACAGLGISGLGYQFAGSQVEVMIEQNPRYAQYLEQHKQSQVIHGDVSDPKVVTRTMEALTIQGIASHTVSAGMACQPFSKMGDQRQGEDPRAESMVGTLAMAFYTGATAVVLECTTEAYTSPWVQSNLQEFSRVTKYSVEQRVLKLDATWSAKRNRWWCVLLHPAAMNKFQLPDMPALRFSPTTMHVMPGMLAMSPQEEAGLVLDDQEVAVFEAFAPGIKKLIINRAAALPTATHSWGSQATKCDCGCRTQGFADSRLRSRGIHAVLVPVIDDTESDPNVPAKVRHLHPLEVGVFNGVPPSLIMVAEPKLVRLVLSGVGQMGSPLQSAWVLSNLKFQVMQQFPAVEVEHPRVVVASICRQVISEVSTVCAAPVTPFNRALAQEVAAIDTPWVFAEFDQLATPPPVQTHTHRHMIHR